MHASSVDKNPHNYPVSHSPQNISTKMKLYNGANEGNVINAHNYRTSLSQIVKDIHTFSKKMDVEYTSSIEQYENDLARAKQEVAFLKASLAK